MCPDDDALDHLQHVGIAAAVGKAFQHDVEHTRNRPATELLGAGVPIAALRRKVTLSRIGRGDPESPFQDAVEAEKSSKTVHFL
jgi:hypothetical protein